MNYQEKEYQGIGDGKIILIIFFGIIFILLGLYCGSKIHKKITPNVAGSYVGTTLYEYDGIVINVSDEIICIDDHEKTASIVRTFEYEDHNSKGLVKIKSKEGRWKNKHRAFKLSFSDFEYISDYTPVNSKGRKIKAKKFMDSRIKILKKELTTYSANLMYKQKYNDKREWIVHSFLRTEK